MPATLSAGARTYWRELRTFAAALGLTTGDRRSLELTCEALELHRTTTKVLVEQGATYETTNAAGGECSGSAPRPRSLPTHGAGQ